MAQKITKPNLFDLGEPSPVVLGYTDKFIRCRTYGHAMDDGDNAWADDEELFGGVPDTMVCARCGVERRDVLKVGGKVIGRTYRYPPGYLMTKGIKRPRRDDFRLRMLAMKLQAAKRVR